MTNNIRGDDDVLALLNEMTGGDGPSSSPPERQHRIDHSKISGQHGDDGTAASATAHNPPSSPSFSTTLAAAYQISPPSNPQVEIVRHRCHEKFKASFYDLFRFSSAQSNKSAPPSSGSRNAERNQCIRSVIHAVWKSMPPHSIWERFQFSLKTLEGDCVREAIQNENDYTPPWLRPNASQNDGGEQLLGHLICPTAHQINAWTIAGRCNGTVWEPLLPVPFISSYSNDSAGELQVINEKYRRGTQALLKEEIVFQFRRTFKQQLGNGAGGKQRISAKGKNQVVLSVNELFASLKDLDDAASNEANARKESKKSKKERNKSAQDNDNINKEEYILQTILGSNQFHKLTQKIHKKFHNLAEDSFADFLTELQKCSNRCISEEQSRLSSGGRNQRKRKHGKNGSGAGGMPKIAFVEDDDEGRFGGGPRTNTAEEQRIVTFAGVSLKINHAHERKLYSLYQRMMRSVLRRGDDERYEEYLGQFPKFLFAILLRYDALEGAGLQSAIPPTVFHFLHDRFGCEFECFASPFNCWFGTNSNDGSRANSDSVVGGRFGSAFGDTDALFGAVGSFFGMDFLEIAKKSGGACFQANPPFASEFIERMCHRMHQFLSMPNDDDGDTERERIPLMFVIFVPAWSESDGWKTLRSSPHLTKHLLLSQKDDVHYYAEGTQHRRAIDGNKGSHRVASFDTSVFFLQNHAGKEKWLLSNDEDENRLKSAFAMNLHSGEDRKGNRRGGKDIYVKKSEQSAQVPRPPQKQGRQNDPIASAKRKKKKKLEGRKEGASKKKKLMSGPSDEMSILASMGILDSGPSSGGDTPKDTVAAITPKGSTNSKKKKRRRK